VTFKTNRMLRSQPLSAEYKVCPLPISSVSAYLLVGKALENPIQSP
jgi:hypothetical protein